TYTDTVRAEGDGAVSGGSAGAAVRAAAKRQTYDDCLRHHGTRLLPATRHHQWSWPEEEAEDEASSGSADRAPGSGTLDCLRPYDPDKACVRKPGGADASPCRRRRLLQSRLWPA